MKTKEIIKCWACRAYVEINDYGYGVCHNRFDHKHGGISYVFGERRGYKVIRKDGAESELYLT